MRLMYFAAIALVAVLVEIAKRPAENAEVETAPVVPEQKLPGLGESTEENFTFPSKGASIAATLKRPNVSRQCPAVVLVAGGGPNKRNDSRIMNALSEVLAQNGIASLRYDKRGLGDSTGDLATFTSEDLANDVRAAIECLKDRVNIDSTKIGLIGHSEGGTIVQHVAATHPDLAFVVALAPPQLPGDKFFESQLVSLLKAQGAEEAEIAQQLELLRKEHEVLATEPDNERAREKLRALHPVQDSEGLKFRIAYLTSPWRRYANAFDIKPDLQKLKGPILVMFAGNDLQVTAEENPTITADNLTAAQDATVIVIDGLNHAFQASPQGLPSETEPVSPVVLELIKMWVVEHV